MSDVAKLIGTKLRELRKARGFTVRAVAERIGISRENCVRLELGKHEPKISTVLAYAEALGCDAHRDVFVVFAK